MKEVESAVEAILKCEHDYENRAKLCSCLSDFSPAILLTATNDRRVGLHRLGVGWKIRDCIVRGVL